MSQVWSELEQQNSFLRLGCHGYCCARGPKLAILLKMSFQRQSPSEFLKQIIGKPVVVKLNSGVDYRGLAMDCWCALIRIITCPLLQVCWRA